MRSLIVLSKRRYSDVSLTDLDYPWIPRELKLAFMWILQLFRTGCKWWFKESVCHSLKKTSKNPCVANVDAGKLLQKAGTIC